MSQSTTKLKYPRRKRGTATTMILTMPTRARIHLLRQHLTKRTGRRWTVDQTLRYVLRHWLHGQAVSLRRRGIDPVQWFDELRALDKRRAKAEPFDPSILEQPRRDFSPD